MKRILHLKRALSLVWRSAPGWTAASFIVMLVQAVLPLLALYLMKLIVDTSATELAAHQSATFRHLAFLIGLAALLALVTSAIRSLGSLISEAQADEVTDYMQEAIHAKSVEVDLEFYENPVYQDTLHRAQHEAPFRPTRLVNSLVQVIQNGISLLAIGSLLLFSLPWGITLLLILSPFPGILLRLKNARQMYQWQRNRTSTERRIQYFNWLLTLSYYAKELRLFNLGAVFRQRSSGLRKQLRKEKLKIATRRSGGELVTQAGATAAIFASFAFVAYRTIQGVISLGHLVMYYQALQRAQDNLREMLSGLANLYENNLFLTNVYEFLTLAPQISGPLAPQVIPRPMRQGICFENVSFRYRAGFHQALKDIRLTIEPGEIVALVGENGSGKTTLVKLLCRLYDPTIGRITLDGIDIREFDPSLLRREISVIFQDFVQYELTAKENIWFGNTELSPDHPRIVRSARESGADDVIRMLPRSYDTVLGKMFEEGEELSIGQWQKVALARAFLRNSQIIVLDEPTSALDAKAEYDVFNRFRELAEGRSALLISHRLSTVKMADTIYVLDQGQIVERGTHDQLVRHGATYANLFEMQAQSYR